MCLSQPDCIGVNGKMYDGWYMCTMGTPQPVNSVYYRYDEKVCPEATSIPGPPNPCPAGQHEDLGECVDNVCVCENGVMGNCVLAETTQARQPTCAS